MMNRWYAHLKTVEASCDRSAKLLRCGTRQPGYSMCRGIYPNFALTHLLVLEVFEKLTSVG